MKNITPSILFATKCYGKDFHHFLSGAFERKTPDYPFDKKMLLINNGVPSEVKFNCDYVRVDDYADKALKFFGLDKDSFKRDGYDGYVYSIAEIVVLYLAQGYDYLFYCQGDCLLEGEFVAPAIKILQETDIAVVSPNSAVNTYHDQDNVDREFSDQCFVLRPKDFKRFYDKPDQSNFPNYGGASFEYKLGQWLKNNNKYRKILSEAYVHHEVY